MSREESKSKISKRTGLSHSELAAEADREIGDNLKREWELAQK